MESSYHFRENVIAASAVCNSVFIVVASTVEHTGPGRSRPLVHRGGWPTIAKLG